MKWPRRLAWRDGTPANTNVKQVSAAADWPARRDASRPPCCTHMQMVSVINWWPMTVTSWSHWASTYVDNTWDNHHDNTTFRRFTNMVGAHENLNGSRDLTPPLSGLVCHHRANTCYRQPTHQIWSLYLYSLLIYERRYKMSEIGWFGGS